MRLSKTQTHSKEPLLRIRAYWGDILYDTALLKKKGKLVVGSSSHCRFILNLSPEFSSNDWEIASIESAGLARLVYTENMQGHFSNPDSTIPLRQLPNTQKLNKKGQYITTLLREGESAAIAYQHTSFYFDWIQNPTTLPHRRTVNHKEVIFQAIGALLLAALMWGVSVIKYPNEASKPSSNRMVEIFMEPQTETKEPVITPIVDTLSLEKRSTNTTPNPSHKSVKEKSKPTQEDSPKAAVPALPKSISPKPKNLLANTVTSLRDLKVKAPTLRNGAGLSLTDLSEPIKAKMPQLERLKETKGQGKGLFQQSTSKLTAGAGLDGTHSQGLTKAQIDLVVNARRQAIQRCYEAQLLSNHTLSGTVVVKFIISLNGSVKAVRDLPPAFPSRTVTQCILSEVRTWRFPKPNGGIDVTVEYPFSLLPSGQ